MRANWFLEYFFFGILLLTISCVASIPSTPPLTDTEKALIQKFGGEILPDGNFKLGKITVDRNNMEIFFPARINMSSGDLEALICSPNGRTHESLLVSEADPFNLQLALILLGAENGLRTSGGHLPQGTIFLVDISADNIKRCPIEKYLRMKHTGKEKVVEGWVFVGSSFTHDGVCLAKEEGNLINVWSFGNTILDNPDETGISDDIIEVFSENTPKYGTDVIVHIKPKFQKL
jgi:hypothetical protein